ncbi:MAG: FtsX-like permease family protein [Clostridioides sp.]|jgi:ABC-type antimicrobial peptide transport system permease subunit|nr:FtsX-like permease family protein [Clostridioides sp.]
MRISGSFKDGVDINKEIKNIVGNLNLNGSKNVHINRDLISARMDLNNIGFKKMSMPILMSIICMIIVYGMYNISIYKRLEEYGTLRAIGSNKKSILSIIMKELGIFYITATPLGVILGLVAANIINKLGKKASPTFIFSGEEVKLSMSYPILMILAIVIIMGLVTCLISLLVYMQVSKNSIVDLMNQNFDSKYRKRKSMISLGKFSGTTKAFRILSLKNILKKKKIFLMVVVSMSITASLYIFLNYKLNVSLKLNESSIRDQYLNSDFGVDEYSDKTVLTGISEESKEELKNLKGVKSIETMKKMPSRLVIDDKKKVDMKFYKETNNYYEDTFIKSVYGTEKDTGEFVIKNSIKGYDDNALKKIGDYVDSGEIDLQKMKKENICILNIPKYVEGGIGQSASGRGNKALNIKVGDKISVKFRKDRNASEDSYWTLTDKSEYVYKEYTVGAITYYSYMNSWSGLSMGSPDVILSDEKFEKDTGVKVYSSINIFKDNNADVNTLEKGIVKISSKDKNVMYRNLISIRKDMKDITDKQAITNLGIISVVFVIASLNIVNNIGYNVISRKNEFGMLQAIGLSRSNLKKMVCFEGLLYAVFASLITVAASIPIEIFSFKHSGVFRYGISFEINYVNFIIMIVINLLLGYMVSRYESRQFKNISIVDMMNKNE